MPHCKEIQCLFCDYVSRKDNILKHCRRVHTFNETFGVEEIGPIRIVDIGSKIYKAYCFNCKNILKCKYESLSPVRQFCKAHKCQETTTVHSIGTTASLGTGASESTELAPVTPQNLQQYAAIEIDTDTPQNLQNSLNETMGYIYCFSNISMPGIFKIGMTLRTPEERLREANIGNTWKPPTSYQIELSKYIRDPKRKETILHTLLSKFTKRINKRREFLKFLWMM